MSIVPTNEKLSGLLYVVVTASKVRTSYEEKGLLVSLKPLKFSGNDKESDDLFLSIYKEGTVCMLRLNPKHYFIKTIEYSVKESTEVVRPYSNIIQAQEDAVTLLNSFIEHYRNINKTIGEDVINIDEKTGAYANASDKIKQITKKNGQNKATNNITGLSTVSNNKNTALTGYTPPPVKKPITTSVIKRTTKYDVVDAILAMKIKVNALKNGSYVAPEIQEPQEEQDYSVYTGFCS